MIIVFYALKEFKLHFVSEQERQIKDLSKQF